VLEVLRKEPNVIEDEEHENFVIEDAGYYMPADITEIKLYGGESEFPVRLQPENA